MQAIVFTWTRCMSELLNQTASSNLFNVTLLWSKKSDLAICHGSISSYLGLHAAQTRT